MSTRIIAKYIGDDRVEITHPTGNIIITDLPPDNGGKGRNFSPTDLLAAAISSCILTIMGVMAKKYSVNIENTLIEIEKHMSSNPRRVGKLIGKIRFPNNIDKETKKKLMTAISSCPVTKSLHSDIEISIQELE